MKQILIVDDESRLLKTIVAGLRCYEDQFAVLTAENGKVAAETLATNHVDLVVTDLRMPEMDGFELLAHLSSNHPFIPSIVMTAFSTPEIEQRVNSSGSLKLLDKPLDFHRLAEAILEGLSQEGNEGSVAGFSLSNFLQLLNMEKKTCLLKVQSERAEGYIYLQEGEIRAALSGALKGEKALFELLVSDQVRITFQKLPKKKVTRMIDKPLMALLIDGMRYRDEQMKGSAAEAEAPAPADALDVPAAAPAAAPEDESSKQPDEKSFPIADESITGGIPMAKLEEILNKLKDVDGFMAVGVFTPNGEMASQVNTSGIKLAEVGSLANDVLLKAQKATDVMNVGLGRLVHIEAPNAHIFARCLNENTDFTRTESGKAHIHMVLLLEPDGNMAMGKMKLETVIQEVAATFR